MPEAGGVARSGNATILSGCMVSDVAFPTASNMADGRPSTKYDQFVVSSSSPTSHLGLTCSSMDLTCSSTELTCSGTDATCFRCRSVFTRIAPNCCTCRPRSCSSAFALASGPASGSTARREPTRRLLTLALYPPLAGPQPTYGRLLMEKSSCAIASLNVAKVLKGERRAPVHELFLELCCSQDA